MAQSLADVVALVRKMFAREQLPELPPHEPARRSAPGAFRLLFGAEALGEDPVPPRRERQGLLTLLRGAEPLPEDPVASYRRGPGFLALVLGREPLPEDPPGPPHKRARWAAWLFSPERIDPS
jgi:hypothetical protein